MTVASSLPSVGAFVLPVQGFQVAYCLQVTNALDRLPDHAPGIRHLTCKRWGLNDSGQPYDDGHHNVSYYTARITQVGEHTWHIGDHHSSHGPVYFKQIQISPTKGQQELFA